MSHVDNFKELLDKPPEAPEEPLGQIVPGDTVTTSSSILEAIDSVYSTLAPSAIEKSILEYTLSGVPISQIAFKLGIPVGHVRTFIRRPKVKEYLKEVREALVEIDQLMLTDTLRKIVGARIENLEDPEDFSQLTRKDTLDVIKVFLESNVATAKGQKDAVETNVFTTIYAQVM